MKRVFALLFAAALAVLSVTAANAEDKTKIVCDSNVSLLIHVPESWEVTKYRGEVGADANVPAGLDVVYDTEIKPCENEYLRIGSSPVNELKSLEPKLAASSFTVDYYMDHSSYFTEERKEKVGKYRFGTTQFLVCDWETTYYIAAKDGILYQFEFLFEGAPKEKNKRIKEIVNSIIILGPPKTKTTAPAVSGSGSGGKSEGSFFSAVLLFAGMIGAALCLMILKNPKLKRHSEPSKNRQNNPPKNQTKNQTNNQTKNQPQATEPPPRKTEVKQPEPEKAEIDPLTVVLAGVGYDIETPSPGDLIELAADRGDFSEPKITWAYCPADSETASVVGDSLPVPGEMLESLSVEKLVEWMKKSITVPEVRNNANFDSFINNRELKSWCDSAKRIQ